MLKRCIMQMDGDICMNNYKELLERYDTDELIEDLKEYGIVLDENQVCQLLKYYEILLEWNSFMNLTGITEYKEVIQKHFVDSLSLAGYMDLFTVHTVIDIGTGAGFPGIPLKIAFPHLKITLLDSLKKRIGFLNHVIEVLELSEINTVHGRAEDFARPDQFRESFDLCVSRAVANLSTLSEYCLPFVKTGGMFVSYKSEKVSEELEESGNAIHLLGGFPAKRNDFILHGSDFHRTLIFIQKQKKTPLKYPRKAGLPSKDPLC